ESLCISDSCARGFDLYSFLFFFFQAEDGIRDRTVTGVQTCALPILAARGRQGLGFRVGPGRPGGQRGCLGRRTRAAGPLRRASRSEERRVGKECRCGWWGWS